MGTLAYWWDDYWPGVVMVSLLCLLVFALFMAVKTENEAKARFMGECRQDHKEYECTAMWRAGEKDVVPVPIVIPIR